MEEHEQHSVTNTILVLDIDQQVTRAVLCDVVEGVARLIDIAEAPTTSGSPFYSTTVGLHRALHRLEDESGRTLLNGERLVAPVSSYGDGVDIVIITGLPVPPIRVGLVAIDADDLSEVLAAAAHRSISQLFDVRDYVRWNEINFTPSVLEGWLRDARPTTLILVSKNEPVDEWRASLEIIAGVAPQFGAVQAIIVGDDQRQNVAAEVLDDVLELSGIDPGSYRQDEIASAVEAELRDQYAAYLQREPAFEVFTSATFVDRLQAVDNVAAFLHRRMGRNLALVLGQEGTLLKLASGQRGYTIFRADLDLAAHARSMLQTPPSQIGRWLPFQVTEDEVNHWLLNRSLRPLSLIDGQNDRAIASAAARELLSGIRERARISATEDLDLIVLGNEWLDLTGEVATLAILDGLQPLPEDGLVMISIDRDNIAASLGAIAAVEPDYAREVVENDFLAPLASCIVFDGTGEFGETVARVEIATENGERAELELKLGEIERYPLPEGSTAEVNVYPEGPFSVGRQGAGEPVYYVGDRAVLGADFGIIFDTRGRPVDLPIETEARVASLSRWSQALGTQAE